MEIKYKIIGANTVKETNLIVWFFTDIVTEEKQCIQRGPNGEVERIRCEYLVPMPLVKMSEAELDLYIKNHCPYQWFIDEEKRLLAEDGVMVDPGLASVLTLLSSIEIGKTNVVTFPDPPKTNADWIAIKSAQIANKRDQLILSGGFKLVHNNNTYWFHSNILSTSQQLGLIIGAILLKLQGAADDKVVHPVPWKTLGGQRLLLTVGIVISMLQASFAHQAALFAAGEQHEARLKLSEDPSAYNIEVDWPPTFQQ